MTDSPSRLRSPAQPPPGYRLAHRFFMTERRALIWMNLIGTLGFVFALAVVFAGLSLYGLLGSPLVLPGQPEALSAGAYFLMVVGTLLLHEGLHGAVIRAQGFQPRFGMKLSKLVLYTTSDAIFTRNQYLSVTLAPLLGISLLGLAGMLIMPRGVALWIGIMVAFNAASSIGDMWMAAVITSFAGVARFRDEEDGMSVFLPASP